MMIKFQIIFLINIIKNRLQNERLKILTQVIRKREEENEKYNNERLAKIWQKKLQQRNELQEKLQKRMVKGIYYLLIFSKKQK